MSRIAERGLKAFESAGLFEPRSRSAKLRHLLPGIEKALSEGASIENCRDTVKTLGIVFPTHAAFKVALYRARQSQTTKGPSLPAEVRASGAQNTPTAPSPLTGEQHVTSRASSLSEPSEGKKSKLIRGERKERLTNPEPSMDDFV